MIERKRLEELIEQGATIYSVCYGVVYEENLNKSCHFGFADNKESLLKTYCNFDDDVYTDLVEYLVNLYETKEEAEWQAEFGRIERTERLVLPTWEELDIFFEFKDKNGNNILLTKAYGNIYLQKCSNTIGFIEENFFKEKATQENYTLACRKAKELFLGGKDE